MDITEVKTGPLTLHIEGEVRQEMRGGFMEEEVFSAAVDHMIIACTDVVVINRERRTLFLCRRAVRPMKGLWVIGGRRRKGETPLEGIRRCFKRETGLDLPEGRFDFVLVTEHLWQDREQEPRDHGLHYLGHQFSIELTQEEFAHARDHLDSVEFDAEFGLQEFTRERLIQERAHPVLLLIYNVIFQGT